MFHILFDAPAKKRSPLLILDEFTDTNGTSLDAHTIAPTNVPATSWTENRGAFDIQSNKANLATAGGSTPRGVASCDAGVAAVIAEVVVTPGAGNSISGIAGRLTDADNFWAIQVDVGNDLFQIVEWQGAGDTVRAGAAATIAAGTPYTIRVTFNGTNITATLDGGNQISYGSATFNQAATKFGVFERSNTTGTTWDNFTVTTV